MALFNLFKKKKYEEPIREFTSDANSFSLEEIKRWMQDVVNNPSIMPPVRSDEYIKELIIRLQTEPDISILDDITEGDFRTLNFTIARNGTDYVSLSYLLSDPNVMYITTMPYPFAGDATSFMVYCNCFQHSFPMVSIGVKDIIHEIEIEGKLCEIPEPMYTVRTILPLLGNENDYDYLCTALRCLPIYGYDLRDGYHSNDYQPYKSKQGVNIQLEKLINIHRFKDVEGLYPAEISLYGHGPFMKISTEAPAYNSNPILQYLNMCYNPRVMFSSVSNGEDKIIFHNDKNNDEWDIKQDGIIKLYCYPAYPTLYTLVHFQTFDTDKADIDIDGLLKLTGEFNFAPPSSNVCDQLLYKCVLAGKVGTGNLYNLQRSVTCSIPNIVDAKNIAYQMAAFLSKIPFPKDILD